MFTEIILILDESGSMAGLKSDTVGNVNKFIEEQKQVPGKANFTLVFFNNDVRTIIDNRDLQSVRPIAAKDYNPDNNTALLDALGETIDSVGHRLAGTPKRDRPDKVIVATLTDGLENYSQKYSREKIFDMISHQRQKYSWEFIFLGANLDAVQEGTSLGIAAAASINYTATRQGLSEAYSRTSNLVKKSRT